MMQALPKALAARGHRVMVVAPRYRAYPDAWETGVRLRLRVFDSAQEVSVLGPAWNARRKAEWQALPASVRLSVHFICPPCASQVGFFHSFHEGVDHVFVDHPAYHAWAGAQMPGKDDSWTGLGLGPAVVKASILWVPPPFVFVAHACSDLCCQCHPSHPA